MNIGSWFIVASNGDISINSNQYFNLGATGITEVLQNVRVIVTTRIGEVQLDRRFGTNWSFVDMPMNVAQQVIVTNVCYALEHFEPRVTFRSIQFAPNIKNPGEMDVLLAISINASELTAPNN